MHAGLAILVLAANSVVRSGAVQLLGLGEVSCFGAVFHKEKINRLALKIMQLIEKKLKVLLNHLIKIIK